MFEELEKELDEKIQELDKKIAWLKAKKGIRQVKINFQFDNQEEDFWFSTNLTTRPALDMFDNIIAIYQEQLDLFKSYKV